MVKKRVKLWVVIGKHQRLNLPHGEMIAGWTRKYDAEEYRSKFKNSGEIRIRSGTLIIKIPK
jgi:hypothetical protein